MISYELAKQLKNAGFPQPWDREQTSWVLGMDVWGKAYAKYIEGRIGIIKLSAGLVVNTQQTVYIPSLSELIEACGNKLQDLKNHEFGNQTTFGKKWEATDGKSCGIVCGGDIPEEAVAKLWLELKNKLSTVII